MEAIFIEAEDMGNRYAYDAEQVLIVHLQNDILVENVHSDLDIETYLDRFQNDAKQVELISLGEFNERLDDMLLHY
ncbi:hypothetical protein [Paenibacillus lutrae]|nr:hypothetical protein [Paenibacillus lutrae]